MPELPEVEVFKKYLDGTALHQKISSFSCREERLLKKHEQTFREHLLGKEFSKSKRIGKYLFVETTGDRVLVMHFGMTGNLNYFKDIEDRSKHAHVVFQFENGFHLAFENQRKFGWIDLAESIESYKKEKDLSDDARDLSWEAFKASFKNRKSYIKPVLMDQSVAAGIGNWMADEILYQAKIHPESKMQNLDEKHIRKVYDAMKKVIEVSIENDAVYRDFPDDFLIHNRKINGKCHHTGNEIQKIKVGGRATYFCPEWQEKIT